MFPNVPNRHRHKAELGRQWNNQSEVKNLISDHHGHPVMTLMTHPEEDNERIVVWKGEQEERYKGRDAAVENGRTHVSEGGACALVAGAQFNRKFFWLEFWLEKSL